MHVELDTVTVDLLRLGDVISYTSGEITAAEALNGVIGASREYRLVFSSARAA